MSERDRGFLGGGRVQPTMTKEPENEGYGKESTIMLSFNALKDHTQGLHQTIERLAERLIPVMQPRIATTEEDKPPKIAERSDRPGPVRSALCEMIDEQTLEIAMAVLLIDGIIGRLEI